MPFDRAAHRAQIARIVTHDAGGEVLLRWNGKGEAFPAILAADRPVATKVDPNIGAKELEIVTIARDARGTAGNLLFAAKQPREGQHFTDSAGLVYRIQEDRSVKHAATLVYACAVSNS